MVASPLPPVARDPTVALALVGVGVYVVWGHVDGGFSPSAFGFLGTLLVAAAAVALALPRASLDRGRGVALAAVAGLTAWTALSVLWAPFRGEAWLAANKMLLYAAALTVFLVRPWTSRARTLVLAVHVFGIALVGALALLELSSAARPLEYLTDGRVTGPVAYVNGSVALWMAGYWPAAWLAGVRAAPHAARALAGAAAAFLLCLVVLGQSRGWLYLLPLGVILFVALARERLRALLALGLTGAAAVAAYPLLAEVSARAAEGSPVAAAIDRAALAAALAALAAAAAFAVWAVVDARVVLSPRVHRAAVAAVASAAAVLLGGGLVVAAASVAEPREFVSERWSDFTSGAFPEGRERFSGALGTNRYREWVVAWELFLDHPLHGVGGDNYAAAYLRARPNDDYHPRYPHSTPLRLLSQLGLVGFALFAVATILLVAAALRVRRRLDPVGGGAVGVALTVFGYWLVHGSIDWFWEIPALAAPAFALLGLAAAPSAAERPVARPPRRPRLRVAAAAGAAIVLSVPLLFLWLADSYVDAAVARWRAQPADAYRWLDRAARLDRLSAEPLVIQGGIALRRGEGERARRSFAEAVEREPENWYAHFQLGLLAALRADWDEAGERVGRARELNPQEPVLATAERLVAARAELDPLELNRRLVDEP